MKALKYIRSGHLIETHHSDGSRSTKDYKTVNKAKKASHKLQMAEGGLGQGSLMVL